MKTGWAARIVLTLATALTGYDVAGQTGTTPPPLTAECQSPDVTGATAYSLPVVAAALKSRREIRILVFGTSSKAGSGPSRDSPTAVLERLLENALKGIEVQIISRGVSGELATDASERIKVEVALNHPDLVLWQVGTFDAMAQVPVDDFQTTVGSTIKWLKEHNTDVIIVGMHYVRPLSRDQHYQELRNALRRVADEENVMRIGRYEAMEALEKAQVANPVPPDDFEMTEAAYGCMAQYAARAIAASLFAKPNM